MIHPVDLPNGEFILENAVPVQYTLTKKVKIWLKSKLMPIKIFAHNVKDWWQSINEIDLDQGNYIFDLAEAPGVSFANSNRESEDQWQNYFEFVLSCTAYAVNLYNVGTFPYECFQGGGGAIIIPYIILTLLVAVPILTIDIALSQFANLHSISCFNFCPVFRGVGISFLLVACIFETIFSTFTSWGVHQLFFSFTAPWYRCDNWWNNKTACVSTVYSKPPFKDDKVLSVQEDFRYRVIRGGHKNSSMSLSWTVTMSFCLIWILQYFIHYKGVHSSTKVLHITGIIPYCILLIVFMYGWHLPGSGEGWHFLFVPKWADFINFRTWYIALKQVLFSFGLSRGSYQTFASRNGFHFDIFHTVLFITSFNIITNILSSTAVMQILGHMKHILKVKDFNSMNLGFDLIFYVYPQGFAYIQASDGRNFMCFLCFFMISCLGLNSMSLQYATILTTIEKETNYFTTNFRKQMLSLGMCFLFFLVGIMLLSSKGYMLRIVIEIILTDTVIFLCFLQIAIVAWIYGFIKIRDNIFVMLHIRISRLWFILWTFVTPIILMIILCIRLAINWDNIYTYSKDIMNMIPMWYRIQISIVFNFFILTPILCYMAYFAYHLFQNQKKITAKRFFKLLFSEPQEWGPRLKCHWTMSKIYRNKLKQLPTHQADTGDNQKEKNKEEIMIENIEQ